MIKAFVVSALVIVAVAVPVHAQVGIDIGIHLPGPPAFVVVQGSPVYYAPRAPANVFFYAHQYWAFNNGWYVGQTWNGPWAAVAPPYVPAPILHVPVAYYPVPPRQWRAWRREGAPHWDAHYGREWHEEKHERDWREHEEHWARPQAKGCPPGLAKQGRC